MDFLDLARERYSVREFKDEAVKDETIEKILEAARLAPTAKNNQPQRIYLLESRAALEKINSICRCIFGAKTVFLICYDQERVWKSPFHPDYNSGEVDASIVCTHMMMEAWQEGVGSCWVGLFDHDEVQKAFSLPPHIRPVALLPVGYLPEESAPSPRHTLYRENEDMVERL